MNRRPLANVADVAEYLNIAEKTVRQLVWRRQGIGLCAFHVGKNLRWTWDDIDAYVESQKRSRDEAAA